MELEIGNNPYNYNQRMPPTSADDKPSRDLTRRKFLGAGSAIAASLLPACSKNPQDEQEERIRKEVNVRKPDKELNTILSEIVDKSYDIIAQTPGVKAIPPKPRILIQEGNAVQLQGIHWAKPEGQVTSLLISEGAIKKLTRNELRVAIAHEVGHFFINLVANGVIRDNYKMPQLKEIPQDLKSRGISENTTAKLNAYKNELCADALAMYVTQDPKSLAGFLSKSGIKPTNDYHPSDTIRFEAAILAKEHMPGIIVNGRVRSF